MKRILLHAILAGGTALPILLLGTATAASAEESCVVVVCSSPQPTEPQPQPQPQPEPQPAPAPKPSHRSSAEITADLLVLLNRDRAAHGLPTFTRRDDVDGVAAGWSDHLADADELSHNDAYFTSESRQRLGARALGENVAMDYEAEPAHEHLMASPHHRDNILDARFTVIGLGATYRDGKWWITEDFLQPASPAGREVARSAGAPAQPSPPRAAAVARPTPSVAAPAPTTIPDAVPAVEAATDTPVELSDSRGTQERVQSTFTSASPATPSSGKVPVQAAGVAVAGMCGVSGLFARRRRVLAELAATS
jgi:uncharacterized protein YkwD